MSDPVVSEKDFSLTSQCLAFRKTLARPGQGSQLLPQDWKQG